MAVKTVVPPGFLLKIWLVCRAGINGNRHLFSGENGDRGLLFV